MNKVFSASLLALTLVGCSATPPLASSPAEPVPAFAGAVSAADPRAQAAGEAMLARGGSATDAAIAVMLALTVVEPQSSGIGGGGFMVRGAADGTVGTFDGRETAPAGATPEWFFNEDGTLPPRGESVRSGLSVGVPGSIALAAKVHAAHGTLAWAELFEPAIRLARAGCRLAKFIDSARSVFRLNNPPPFGLATYFHCPSRIAWPRQKNCRWPSEPPPSNTGRRLTPSSACPLGGLAPAKSSIVAMRSSEMTISSLT